MPPGSAMDRIVRRGTLVAGVNQNAYRVGYRDPVSGELSGRKVCAATGSTSIINIPTFNPEAIPVSAPDVVDCPVMLQPRTPVGSHRFSGERHHHRSHATGRYRGP
jgi:hypothetical protein